MNIRFNGRPIRPGDLGRTIVAAMENHMQRAMGTMRSELEALRCNKHPECRVTVESTGNGFQLSGQICPEFKRRVESKLTASGALRSNNGGL